jgi:integrase
MARHRESPIKRVNPSGRTVWVARYTAPDGRRLSAGSYKLQRDAQDAIDAAYGQPVDAATVGAYLERWLRARPRSERTDRTNEGRIRNVLDVKLEQLPLRLWRMLDLRRRHRDELVARMLTEQGRAPGGARNILRALSAMFEDAVTDELCDINPWAGAKVRDDDRRAVKPPREPRVWTFEQMHAFAAKAGRYEPMVRVLADCGLRIGELFAVKRSDLLEGLLRVSGSAWEGRLVGDSREKRHEREVPVPPGCMALLRAMPARIDSPLLFPSPRGVLWRYSNWHRRVWQPVCERAGIDPTPHEFRHSYVSHLRAAGIDPADLGDVAGHSVHTATSRYTHPLRRSYDEIRQAIG